MLKPSTFLPSLQLTVWLKNMWILGLIVYIVYKYIVASKIITYKQYNNFFFVN